jgi:RNA polymerase sigma-70 factor, ECF subfamily
MPCRSNHHCAVSLRGSVDRGDDLVQERLLRGIAHIQSFTSGMNLATWLTTITCNTFHNECRKRGRTVEDPKGAFAATLTTQPEQEGRAARRAPAALFKLSLDQREAIILVGISATHRPLRHQAHP